MSLENIESELAAIRTDIKNLTKVIRKIKAKQDDPDGEKAKARSVNNGFNRKQEVSPKLREFIGIKEGELVSRSEVTKYINKYILDKGLKHPDNGRQIVLDDTLKDLLNPPADEQVTYLNIQKYLSPHYIKKEA
jgi:upstream activation factor subunit UAF30|uniref:DM2 domain-containing protein n=1 Tax=Mantoniella tinhauana virus 1 TaxID=3111543 RepID=A0AB38ZM45_9VIRU